jgi:lysozyme
MKKLVQQLKRHEGFRKFVYEDTTGHWTIGYGRNVEEEGVTEKEAEMMLMNDIEEKRKKLVSEINHKYDDDLWKKLNNARRSVLINMAFNLGVAGLMEFDKMFSYIRDDQYKKASEEMLDSLWAEQVGYRAEELSEQMESGEF